MVKGNYFTFEDRSKVDGFMKPGDIDPMDYRGYRIVAWEDGMHTFPLAEWDSGETGVPVADPLYQPLDHIHLTNGTNRIGTSPSTLDRVHRDTWTDFVTRSKAYIDALYEIDAK